VDGLRELVARIAAEEGLEATVRQEYALPPAPMDDAVVAALEESAREQGVEPKRMWSGAGHDAMVIARRGVPTGMVFVPSRRGISHSPEEWTDIADCELGARVLAGGLRRLAS
jgi:allantoate deiminase